MGAVVLKRNVPEYRVLAALNKGNVHKPHCTLGVHRSHTFEPGGQSNVPVKPREGSIHDLGVSAHQSSRSPLTFGKEYYSKL